MENLYKINGGLTEKGNLQRAVQDQIREAGAVKFLDGFERTPKGEYVLAVADVDGTVAYLKVNMAVSIATNLFDEPKSTAKAKADPVDIGNIFG